MAFKISEIAEALGAKAVGDTTLLIASVAEPADAQSDQLAIAMTEKFVSEISMGSARAALLSSDSDWRTLGLSAAILPRRSRYALAGITQYFDDHSDIERGIHPTAHIDPTAQLGDNISIGPYSVIMRGARVGDHSVIGALCMVGVDACIGTHAYLRNHVSIGHRVRIGMRFIAQPGVRIGGDGFSYVTPDVSAIENVRKTLGDQRDARAQSYTRIHSLGAVCIGNDVELGANSTIDNGTIRDTMIGDGCKFDNLSHIGHNVVMGRNCLVSGQSGVAGSARIGNNVVLGGQTGVSDNIFVGDNVISGGGSKILSNVPAGRVVLGYPATKMENQITSYKFFRRLPRLFHDVDELKKMLRKVHVED
ncbi:MAG: UDP-3-O-(3-hydroxymyristoyl)glucosamine N-acyltransferase [Aestuariivita sp.]|nr:UDP-3-O-(3-hydroxymyristoyl)glucosamine N-acyltransferase [Aestuariivita sp.]